MRWRSRAGRDRPPRLVARPRRPRPTPGEWLVVHSGYAIDRVDAADAEAVASELRLSRARTAGAPRDAGEPAQKGDLGMSADRGPGGRAASGAPGRGRGRHHRPHQRAVGLRQQLRRALHRGTVGVHDGQEPGGDARPRRRRPGGLARAPAVAADRRRLASSPSPARRDPLRGGDRDGGPGDRPVGWGSPTWASWAAASPSSCSSTVSPTPPPRPPRSGATPWSCGSRCSPCRSCASV